tara:strand:+ start:222 stop:566 length:345 start_codon:yes stop_codon:yes gene_type:complete
LKCRITLYFHAWDRKRQIISAKQITKIGVARFSILPMLLPISVAIPRIDKIVMMIAKGTNGFKYLAPQEIVNKPTKIGILFERTACIKKFLVIENVSILETKEFKSVWCSLPGI